MNQPLAPVPQKPTLIWLICAVGFLWYGLLFVFSVFGILGMSFAFGWLGLVGGVLWVVLVLLHWLPLIGYFQMRRWGVWLFAVLFVLGLVGDLVDGQFAWWITIINAVVLLVGVVYYRQMT